MTGETQRGRDSAGRRGALLPRLRGMLALTLLGALALWPGTAQAQDSPEALMEAFVASVRTQDRARLRSLIHPAVLASLPEARVRGAVDSWLNHRIPEDYELHARPPAELDAYDPETRTFDLGGLPLRFSVAPELFLEIVATRPSTDQAGKPGEEGAVTGPEVVNAAARHEGRWTIVLPGPPSR